MRYCTRCILPETRPGITLDAEGVCTACRGHDDKVRHIDWSGRADALKAIVDRAKSRSTGYDCVVPVSGGKDSWYQVIQCQRLGLNPLAVTWRTPGRTTLGQRNLDGLIRHLGVDHIDYTLNPDVERRFMKKAFERVGAVGLPMHMALFAIPLKMAVQMRIPLVVWGENPQLEYGGEEAERQATRLDQAWLARHGCLMGTTVEDWIDEEATGDDRLTARELTAWRVPTFEGAQADFVPESIFLGAFMPWDSFENVKAAQAHGFEYAESDRRMGTWSFADIDCEFMSLHHYLKWFKFGFTRAFDNLSVQIRQGQLTRDEAIERLSALGPQHPHADIEAFCAFVGEPVEWFYRVCERFRDPKVWQQRVFHTSSGPTQRWEIPDFIVEPWSW
ncbi:MAG: N-acetyl sugar amidotransferase [Bradymonadia bacterium]